MKRLFGLMAALATGAVLTASQAYAVSTDGSSVTLDSTTDIGSMFDVTFQCSVGDTCNSGVNQTGVDIIFDTTWTLTSVVGNEWIFDIDLANNSTGDARIASFGFSTSPSTTGDLINDGSIDWDIVNGGGGNNDVPGFSVDTCIFAGNNCTGGQSGLETGLTDSITLALMTENPTTTLTLSSFAAAAQSVGDGTATPDSFQFPGTTSVVPLPAGGLLLLFGLGGLGFAARRRRKAAVA